MGEWFRLDDVDLKRIDEALGIGDDGCCDPDQTLDAADLLDRKVRGRAQRREGLKMKKPYRVTAYREYGIARLNEHVVGNFCWYWQANVVSWIWHHLFGFSCNTWKANNETSNA